jgi:hypothetical protein
MSFLFLTQISIKIFGNQSKLESQNPKALPGKFVNPGNAGHWVSEIPIEVILYID